MTPPRTPERNRYWLSVATLDELRKEHDRICELIGYPADEAKALRRLVAWRDSVCAKLEQREAEEHEYAESEEA